jgi:pimeloyl-ACP methyl ester carboxylesterase
VQVHRDGPAAKVAAAVGAVSRLVDLGGPVHYLDFGGQGPTMVLVHGLGGSHVNWLAAGPLLARSARVVAVDLAGFGYTPPAGRSTRLRANQRLLGRFVEEVAGAPALLVGNSMGGTISLLEACEHPERIAGLVLVDPSLPRPAGVPLDRTVGAVFAAYAVPGVGERLLATRRARLGPEGVARETLRLCCVDPSRVPPEVVEAGLALAHERAELAWADAAFLAAARSLLAVLGRSRAYLRSVHAVRAPTLMVHGSADRLVPLASARRVARLRPDWAFVVFREVGHIPQVEVPDRLAATVTRWLAGSGRAAARAASREFKEPSGSPPVNGGSGGLKERSGSPPVNGGSSPWTA